MTLHPWLWQQTEHSGWASRRGYRSNPGKERETETETIAAYLCKVVWYHTREQVPTTPGSSREPSLAASVWFLTVVLVFSQLFNPLPAFRVVWRVGKGPGWEERRIICLFACLRQQQRSQPLDIQSWLLGLAHPHFRRGQRWQLHHQLNRYPQ